MLNTLRLIFTPFAAWERIGQSSGVLWRFLLLSILPWILFSAAAEGIALKEWGKSGAEGHALAFNQEQAMRYEAVKVGLTGGAIFVAACFIQLILKSFNLRTRFSESLTVMGYAFSIGVIGWWLNIIPPLNPWVGWGLGAALAVVSLYHGVALVLKPDQTKGFGLYMVTALLFLIVSGLATFVSLSLSGRGPGGF